MDFANFIEERCRLSGISKNELCKKLGKSHGYLFKIMSKNNPTLKVLENILGELGYEVKFVPKKIEQQSSEPTTETTTEPTTEPTE